MSQQVLLNKILQIVTISLVFLREILLLMNYNSLASVLFYLSVVTTLMMCGIALLSITSSTRMNLVYFVLIVLIISISLLFTHTFDSNLISSIGRIVIILLWFNIVQNTISADHLHISVYSFWNSLYIIILFLRSFSSGAYNSSGQLVYQYGNPNSTGLSSAIACISVLLSTYFQSFPRKICSCFLAFLALFICYKSGSRTSLLMIVFWLIAAVIMKKKQNECTISNYKVKRNRLILFFAFIVAYPLLWILVYNIALLFNLGDINILGKPLFSYRELIWDSILKHVITHPLYPNLGMPVQYGSGPHNVFLSVLWDYGIIAVILFYVVIYNYIKRLNSQVITIADRLIVDAILASLISMTFEVLLFSGGFNFMFRIFYLGAFINLKMPQKKVSIVYL